MIVTVLALKQGGSVITPNTSKKVAANGYGLAMAGHLKNVCPQPKLIEKLKLKITTKSPITNVKLEPKLIANTAEANNVPPCYCQTACCVLSAIFSVYTFNFKKFKSFILSHLKV